MLALRHKIYTGSVPGKQLSGKNLTPFVAGFIRYTEIRSREWVSRVHYVGGVACRIARYKVGV